MPTASLDRDRAYALLRDLVISGEFAPDEPLSERSLSSRLALGRTPIREALKALARDGLLTIHPMRGTFLRQMSFDDLREIHELRLALEGMAAYLAATGQVVSGALTFIVGELLKLVLVERLFHLTRDKLMRIPAFAWVYGKVVEVKAWLQATEAWRVIRAISRAVKDHVARARAKLVGGFSRLVASRD